MKKVIPLFVLCVFLSCEKDDQIIVNDRNNDNSQIKLEYVSSEAYKDNTEVHKVIKNFNLNKDKYLRSTIGNATFENIQAKSTYLPEYGVTIKENYVAHIQAGEYESFTYQIVNTYIDDELHNLFLSKRKDGTYEAYIKIYWLSESQKSLIESGVKPTDLQDSFTFIPVDDYEDLPETAASFSGCEDEPPCPSFPCCFWQDGLIVHMFGPNSCAEMDFEDLGDVWGISYTPTACPTYFEGDGNNGGSSGDSNNSNNDQDSTSGDNETGSDPCDLDPNCPGDDDPIGSGAGGGAGDPSDDTDGDPTNTNDDSTNSTDNNLDDCLLVEIINGIKVCNLTVPVLCVEDECEEDEEDCENNISQNLELDSISTECLFENDIDICNLDNQFEIFSQDYAEGNLSDVDKALFQEFIEIICVVPDARLDRFIQLNNLINQDPWVLIEDCAQDFGLNTDDYLSLYNHTIPASCQMRLNQLGDGYSNQPISQGNVPLANIDYYGVEITNSPDFDFNGIPDTPSEIYQSFKDKFTDLASGSKDDFQFSCDIPFNDNDTSDITWNFEPHTDNDNDMFNSDNPITSIFNIEATATGLGNLVADEGAIIVSEFTINFWTGSSIKTPQNGSQPFSGNRQWGWFINNNGNMELYTRAVDVANISTILNLTSGTNTECQQDTYYNIAQETWQNMQGEIKEWLTDDLSNGGQAIIIPKTAVRVRKEKIIELLTSHETIAQINCD